MHPALHGRSPLCAQRAPPPLAQVFVKTALGRTITLDLNASDTCASVCERAQQKEAGAGERVVFNGKALDDSALLSPIVQKGESHRSQHTHTHTHTHARTHARTHAHARTHNTLGHLSESHSDSNPCPLLCLTTWRHRPSSEGWQGLATGCMLRVHEASLKASFPSIRYS